MSARSSRWDIFCKVIDNFGDAGVAWRLARILAAEHGIAVTLWLDRPEALARIEPAAAADRPVLRARGVTVRRWTEPAPEDIAGDVVVEAFGCGLPEGCLPALAARTAPPRWFILEYLSAEPWIDGAHGLASPHPRQPLSRRFWFPGFTARSGGLLRERGLFAARDAFRRTASAQQALWALLGVPAPAANELRVSLFCYPDAPVAALFDTWAAGDQAVVCVIPEGVAAQAIEQWSGRAIPRAGSAPLTRGRLAAHVVPFVAQDDYDRLLWACDINFVRGEDSFVRAQWAARPFVWQPYPQSGAAHLAKMDAFADRYAAGLAPAAAAAVRRFWQAWNAHPEADPIGAAWRPYAQARAELQDHGRAWAADLAALPELAAGLVQAAAIGV